MLKKLLVVLLCTLVSLIFAVSPASAMPFPFSLFDGIDLTTDQANLIEDLKSKYVPEIERALFPEQQKKFEKAIQEGHSLRKAFRSMALTSDQKNELAAAIKKVPRGRLFAALTPEQKKEIFMNKKEAFIPTPDEIAERIKAGRESEGFAADAPGAEIGPTPEEIAEKIKLGFEKKKAFMPSAEEIQEKISARMEAMTE